MALGWNQHTKGEIQPDVKLIPNHININLNSRICAPPKKKNPTHK